MFEILTQSMLLFVYYCQEGIVKSFGAIFITFLCYNKKTLWGWINIHGTWLLNIDTPSLHIFKSIKIFSNCDNFHFLCFPNSSSFKFSSQIHNFKIIAIYITLKLLLMKTYFNQWIIRKKMTKNWCCWLDSWEIYRVSPK